jgi:RNA polymerase sigma-70 factor (ECF subfamily)
MGTTVDWPGRQVAKVEVMVTAYSVAPGASEPADAALLRAVRLGDQRAFEELFNRHYPRVYAVALKLVGSPQDAEELALDVFVKLYHRPFGDAEDANVAAWLYRVTTNDSFNVLRARRRRLGWLQRVGRLLRRDIGDDEPLAIAVQQDEAARVRRALATLPERQRTALVLRASGLSYAEVADALGVARSSVGTLLARGERALRQTLEREERQHA